MRRTRWWLALALLCVAAGSVRAEPTAPGDALREAEGKIRDGDPQKALEILDDALAHLPQDERAVVWEQDLEGLYVNAVWIGARHVYVLAHVHAWSRHPFVEVAGGPRLTDSKERYDFEGSATCLDAATGAPLWHRRTAGQWQAVVDPENDDLLFWRRDVVRLAADTGEETERSSLGEEWRKIHGLLVHGRALAPRRPTSPARFFDVRAKERREVDWRRRLGISPDESKIASVEPGFLSMRDLATDVDLWRYGAPDRFDHVPFWVDDDLVWRSGTRDGPCALVRLAGTTGAMRWRHVLPRGAWDDRQVRLMGNSPPLVAWPVVGPLGSFLYAVGGDGVIHVCDPATGALAGSTRPVRQPLAPPRVVGPLLVVAGAGRIRAVPLAAVLEGRTPGEIRLRTARARLLSRLGRAGEALAEARRTTDRAPLDADAWRVRADVAARAGETDETVAAHCRGMALSGERVSDALRTSHGLLARIPLGGDVTAPLADVPSRVLVGTRGGRLLHVDPVTLEVLRDERVPEGVFRLRTRHVVSVGGISSGERTLWSDAEPGPDPERTPPEWFTWTGYDGRVVRDGARWIRPLAGGGVRVLDDETVVEHPALLPEADIRTWDLHLGASGPLGYGTGGVYRLDEHHRPERALVTYAAASPTEPRPRVMLLAGDGDTIGLLVQHGHTATLEVRDLDGALLASADVGNPGYVERAAQRLRPHLGGYLFVGDRLVWLCAGTPARTWRFDVGGPDGDAVPLTRFVHTAFFTPPVVRDGRIFVGCRDGGLYVFDAALGGPADR